MAAGRHTSSARPRIQSRLRARLQVADLDRLAARAAAAPGARVRALIGRREPRAARAASKRSLALPIGLICAGSVLSADAVLTLAWQEPLSALYATHEQHVLGGELMRLQETYTLSPLAASRPLPRQPHLAALARRLELSSRAGQPLGRIDAPSIGMNFVVVQGTDASSLTKGPGHYRGTTLPGAPGTTALAGHRTTFLAPFRRVADLRPGASVVVTMPYGRFSYVVLGQRVVSPTDVSVLNGAPGATGSRLVLTTCDPLFSAAKRRVVVAKLVSSSATGAPRV